MPRRNLYRYALEMLNTTNVYAHPLEQLCFMKDHEECSLVAMVKERAVKSSSSTEQSSSLQELKQTAFSIILESLAEYAETYPASYTVKQRIKKKFVLWLKEIAKEYKIPVADEDIKYDFANINADTAVAMLQLLQEPGGVTKEDMVDRLRISPRAILKNLSKIDHSLGDSEQNKECFYIGGQPVQAKIKVFHMPGVRKNHYRTVNTVHPIILQENLMQAGTLIQSLARNYNEYDSDTSYCVGMDIWSQLSEYGKARIRTIFAYGDSAVEDFIRILDDDCPGMEMAAYYTERDMADEFRISNHEALLFCMKAENRRCRLKLFLGGEVKCFENVKIQSVSESGSSTPAGDVFYKAICQGTEEILFTEDQVDDIKLL